jgi:two-component system response regulator NreC
MAAHLRLAPSLATDAMESAATGATEDDARPLASPAIRVILADDHALMRRSLRLLLDNEADLEVIAEADELPLVVRHVHGHRPNVLVLDLSMPGSSGVEAIAGMREAVPETQVVVLTLEENPVYAQRALNAGALGYVLKTHADEELPAAVRAAARGEESISPPVAARLNGLQSSQVQDKLSGREIEVLRLIALGHTSVEIAHKLHLSPRTIETHRTRIHRKLGLSSRSELVRYALGRGLLKT